MMKRRVEENEGGREEGKGGPSPLGLLRKEKEEKIQVRLL